jgi:hypothetical protein
MNLRVALDTSIVISLFRPFYRWHEHIGQKVSYIYYSSQAHRLTKKFWEKIKLCFKYSLLGRITEVKDTDKSILDNSCFVGYLVSFYKRWKHKIESYLMTSLIIKLIKELKEQLYLLPVRAIGIIAIVAIIVNIFLSVILQRQLSIWVWLVRGLFLYIAVSSLFCKADWPTIEQNSTLLKKR